MATFHISETEAARDFAALLAQVRAGAEVFIEAPSAPAVVLRTAQQRPLRRLSESLRMARESGAPVTLDGGFGADLEAAVNSHPEPLKNPWA
jgi:antitoxin (DNA-binding transcriptional repressor) of toxin-antitoxin stability system